MITNLILEGKDNAVTRAQLCAITGMTDRQVRREIEEARHAGAIIANDQDGKGYYVPTSITEIERQFRQNESRFKCIAHQQKPLRRALKAAGRL